ncbi:prepilin-type N-terminal cleavage/methylation domain-containing protein [Candidatus Sumerlaeota bacterium]|nr:prepilin-type N-terminal cleavage/methylation domain-containing protein [Candidatus Sumerlaeota bacterium]
MPSRPRPPERSRRRGVTLIEVMVVSAILAVVTGVVFGILIETQRSCIGGQDRLAMQACARAVTDEVVSVLEAAVRPEYLDDNSTTLTLQFAPEQCEVVSSRYFTGRDFYLTRIGNMPPKEQEAGELQAVLETKALDWARMTDKPSRETRRLIGLADSRFPATVRFDYATDFVGEALEPVFQSTLAPGKYPRVIRVKVTVTDREGKVEKPYELITSARLM